MGGWASGNFPGSDGQPLCVRIASDLDGAFFTTTLASALDSGADWIQLATWNDWNELTQIEPVWRRDYVGAVLNGGLVTEPMVQRVFARAIEARAAIAHHKGLQIGNDLVPGALHAAAAGYLRDARLDPTVVEYD